MRNIAAIASDLTADYTNKPLAIVKIDWGGETGTKYYSGADFDDITTELKLLNIGAISNQYDVNYGSNAGSVTITLDDIDGALKTIINTIDVHKISVEILIGYVDTSLSSCVSVFVGVIEPPFTWFENSREITFDITVPNSTSKIGYPIADGDITPITDPTIIGKAIPLVFGTCLKVPALKLTNIVKATLSSPCYYPAHPNYDGSITVENGHSFPQNTVIDLYLQINAEGINCATLILEGQFITESGIPATDTFTISEYNKTAYTNIALGTRVVDDDDEFNENVFWLDDADINLEGYFVYLVEGQTGDNHSLGNFVIKQVGTKCYCWRNWEYVEIDGEGFVDYGLILLNKIDDVDIDEAAAQPIQSWIDQLPVGMIAQQGRLIIKPGANVTLSTDATAIYACNLGSSIEVFGVYAFREAAAGRVLGKVPSRYYTINLNDTTTLTDSTLITTVYFEKPLSTYGSEKWDDKVIYVSLKSTADSNTVTIIISLISNYGPLLIDVTSSNAVRALVANYPSNFAITEIKPLLATIKDIAWQARCSLLITHAVHFNYISKSPTSTVFDVNEDSIEAASLNIGLQEEITTKFTGTWREDYSPDREVRTIIKENNVDEYGLTERTVDFWIYNIEELVDKSLSFWLNRHSNIWKILNVKLFPEAIKCEIYDALNINLTNNYFATEAVSGILQSSSYNLTNLDFDATIWLPIVSGATVAHADAWDDDTSDTLPDNPFDGGEIDYIFPVAPKNSYINEVIYQESEDDEEPTRSMEGLRWGTVDSDTYAGSDIPGGPQDYVTVIPHYNNSNASSDSDRSKYEGPKTRVVLTHPNDFVGDYDKKAAYFNLKSGDIIFYRIKQWATSNAYAIGILDHPFRQIPMTPEYVVDDPVERRILTWESQSSHPAVRWDVPDMPYGDDISDGDLIVYDGALDIWTILSPTDVGGVMYYEIGVGWAMVPPASAPDGNVVLFSDSGDDTPYWKSESDIAGGGGGDHDTAIAAYLAANLDGLIAAWVDANFDSVTIIDDVDYSSTSFRKSTRSFKVYAAGSSSGLSSYVSLSPCTPP